VALDPFAGIPVSEYQRALAWYELLLGAPPSFVPNEIEAVWSVAEHGWLAIEVRPAQAGTAKHTVFVDDLDARAGEIAARGIEQADVEAYENGVRKITYRDPDGNEIGFGGAASR
jgi:catechol 2,3-dioxygenase-like lactoylglutathione lyase family enzyme